MSPHTENAASALGGPPIGRGAAALPAGFRIALDPGTAFWSGGRMATGGAPWAVVRFGAAAGPGLAALRRAGPRGVAVTSATARALARRLLDRGLAHPVPESRPGPHDVTVVVPAFGRAGELDRCLAAVEGARVIVVDDGSPDPGELRRVAAAHGARLVRHRRNRGPAAARNTGARLADTPFVAFVDSDCRPEPGWLDILMPRFDDPMVAAVGPRVVPRPAGPDPTVVTPAILGGRVAAAADPRDVAANLVPSAAAVTGDGLLARYEAARSALDMGSRPALVRPGARLGFVPTATLVVRVAAVRGLVFDEALRLGEDVDFVWRLTDRGWHVRYAPEARVAHTARLEPVAWARRRHEYGTSAAALADRHPGRLAPARPSAWNLAVLACLASGRPLPAAACAALATGLLARGLRGSPGRWTMSAAIVGQGAVADAAAIGHALRREWWPLGLLCLAASGANGAARAGAAAMLAPVAAEWLTDRPAVDLIRYTALRLVDDLAYGSGVTASAWRHRSPAPLLPRVRLPLPGRRRRRLGAAGPPGGDKGRGVPGSPAREAGGPRRSGASTGAGA
ncbi:glycosyltransferase [Nocardiopsis mangrovi]|uniref:Glycosyltransferase n=1 Tax=Nocardiopsis mangrovi TaxID=1179818 RepID=A0ABV9E395_9ACTN